MSKTRCWILIFLALLLIVLIGFNLTDRENTRIEIVDDDIPTYKSNYSNTAVYSLGGTLNYRLTANYVEHFSTKGISWFTNPVMITFDIYKVPIWLIKSDRAKLIDNYMLYLSGNVELHALTANNNLRKIVTDNVKINLKTQDVISQNLVKLYGTDFNSSGLRMRGNLHNKNAELIENVITYYEIPNK